MTAPLSIIIATLNEEKYLPLLINSINNQTVKPYEIIVSDALSEDKTREVAASLGCKVVKETPPRCGPAKGRNTGEKAATQKMLLFLDSDVILPPNFLEVALKEMEDKKLDIATCFISPISSNPIYKIGTFFTNYLFLLASLRSPHAGGYCIFVRKEIYEKIHGFDETLILGEDHDFVSRASKFGKFGFIKNIKINLSIRRLEEEGVIKTIFKYLLSEFQTLVFGKQKIKSFGIKFGEHKN
jgi:glycosyltransferase involved in cell wall biosynthesis